MPPRRLLQIADQSPENLLQMTDEELAMAMREDLQAHGPTERYGTRNIAHGLFPPNAPRTVPNFHALADKLNRAGSRAFRLLERWGLAQEADGINGVNGYIELTDAGRAATERLDFERIRVRSLLREEMLHPLLRGKVHGYFAAGDLGTAVFEAFKLVEMGLHTVLDLDGRATVKELSSRAFAANGPLVRPGDDKRDREALMGLFDGSLCLFKNPGSHTNRTFDDVLEAMEELMLASRLLRFIDERRPA